MSIFFNISSRSFGMNYSIYKTLANFGFKYYFGIEQHPQTSLGVPPKLK